MYPKSNVNVPAIVAISAGGVSLVLGMVGCFWGSLVLNVLGTVFGIAACVSGALGLKKAEETGAGKALAMGGLICGIFATLFALITVRCACENQTIREVKSAFGNWGSSSGLGDIGDLIGGLGDLFG